MGHPTLDDLFLHYMGVLQPGLSGSDLLVSILGAYHWILTEEMWTRK